MTRFWARSPQVIIIWTGAGSQGRQGGMGPSSYREVAAGKKARFVMNEYKIASKYRHLGIISFHSVTYDCVFMILVD